MEQARDYEDKGTRTTSESEEVSLLGATLQEKLSFINSHKIAANRPVYVAPAPGANGLRPGTASSSSVTTSSSGQAHWVQPSGPRRPGEGTENEEQGIIAAETQPGGGVVLRITLLAAGFIIGPAGSSVREIMRVTGCDIKSWTDTASKSRHGTKRPCRVFVVDGDDEAVGHAMDIITAAIDRYKELCEGRCQGQSVTRQQRVMGVEFSYQPPPRNVVPFAAALKGNITRPPVKSTPELTGRQGGLPNSPLVPMLPGYLMPMPGTYMTPGSPTTGLPFPMYMTQRGATYQDLDLGGGAGNSQVGSGMDMYGNTNFDAMNPMSQLLGSAGQGSWPMANNNLGSSYAYPTTVDPASMMAYMSLMMPPPSPAGTFTAAEPQGGLPAFPAGTQMARSDPVQLMTGSTNPSFGLAPNNGSVGSPQQQAMYPPQPQAQLHEDNSAAQHMAASRQNDMGGFTNVKPMPMPMGSPGGPGRTDFMPGSPHTGPGGSYGHVPVGGMGTGSVPTMGMTGGLIGHSMVPGGFTAMAPYGCWYPSSPPGVAYGNVAWGGAQQGRPGQLGAQQFPGSPVMHASPTGSVPSPSRLNPMAQPWASPPSPHTGFRPPRPQHPEPHHHHEPYGMRPGEPATHPSAPESKATTTGRSAPFATSGHASLTRTPAQPLAESPAGSAVAVASSAGVAEGASRTTGPAHAAQATAVAPPVVATVPVSGRLPAGAGPAAAVTAAAPAATGVSPPMPAAGAPASAAQHDQQQEQRTPPSSTLKIDDTLPRNAPMAVGKTPKRPSASSSTGYQGIQHQGERTSLGSSGVGYSPTTSGGAASGSRGGSAGRPAAPGSNGLYGSGGASGSPARPMVSSEDPLISPSRFTRGQGHLRRPRSQQTLQSEGSSAAGDAGSHGTGANPPATLQALPDLLEAMNMQGKEPLGSQRSEGVRHEHAVAGVEGKGHVEGAVAPIAS